MNHGIILHEEYRERMKKFSPERLGRLVQNLFRVDDGEEPIHFPDDEALDVMSEILCARLERDLAMSEKQRLNRLGKTKQEPKKTKKNQKKPNDNQKKPLLPITNNQLPITNIKKTYGECANVYLTEEEHSKIVNDGLTGLIDELSFYIASKGDKYKSHYAVIKQWAMRRKREQAEKEKPKSNQFTQGVMSRDIDFTDLEKKLIKN